MNYSKIFRGLLLSSVLLLSTPVISYAGAWSNETGVWKYMKNNGTYACNELQLDDSGNLYSFDANGNMMSNTSVGALKFGSTGAWINPMAVDSDKYINWLSLYKQAGTLIIPSSTEARMFMNYVSGNHLLSSAGSLTYSVQGASYVLSSTKNSGLTSALTYADNSQATLQSMVNKNIGSSDRETVTNFANYICSITNYNVNYGYADTILSSGEGRCNSYVQLFNNLCRVAGIKSESVYVQMRKVGQYHALNRIWYDNAWHYWDITAMDTSGSQEYADISYEKLLEIYTILGTGVYEG